MHRTRRPARTTCRYCDHAPDECTCTQEIVSIHTVLEELADGYSIEDAPVDVDLDVDIDDQYWTTLDMRQPFWCETVE